MYVSSRYFDLGASTRSARRSQALSARSAMTLITGGRSRSSYRRTVSTPYRGVIRNLQLRKHLEAGKSRLLAAHVLNSIPNLPYHSSAADERRAAGTFAQAKELWYKVQTRSGMKECDRGAMEVQATNSSDLANIKI